MNNPTETIELSIVLPCLNEERTVGVCVSKAVNFLKQYGVSGEVILDAEKAVPLAVKLTGTISFMRDGRRFQMKVKLDAKVASLGATAIAAPDAAEVVATPERLREVDDRDKLLEGIAPPARRQSESTGGTP